MSFVQFTRILWARRWIIILATLGAFVAALLTIQILPARYEAKSRVMMELLKPDPVTGQIMGGTFARAYTATQTELIRDYRVTGAVVDNIGWTSSPELLAQFNSAGRDQNVDFRRWLAQRVATNTKATPIEGSNILEIAYTANSPDAARTIADALRAAYVDQSLAFKREAAASTADWFDGQVKTVAQQVAAAEARKTAFERSNRIVLQDDDTDTESTRLKALASQASVPSQQVSIGGGASPSALQLATIDARIASLSQTLGPNHPELQDLRRQRTVVAQAAARERSGGIVTGGGPSLAGQVAAQQSLVISQRNKVEQARRLQADVAVLRDQYTKTAQRAADFRQQAASNDSGLTLLGSAVAPEGPSFPNVPLILIGSLVAGFGLGLLSALVTELLSRRVRGVEDLSGTGVPVIIVLSGWGARRGRIPLMQRLRLRAPEPA